MQVVTDTVASPPPPVRQTGRIKFFDTRKGFGFIKPDDGSKDVFLSINRVPREGAGVLRTDQRCSYVLVEGPKGCYADGFAWL